MKYVFLALLLTFGFSSGIVYEPQKSDISHVINYQHGADF
ncbi:hypothetical protein PMI05_02597 [Brevibacillus sp. BC25]|nr:hypothetical protein PMI05_02597 [Brevibacillus sp. BC25]